MMLTLVPYPFSLSFLSSPHSEQLSKFIADKWDLKEAGFNYNVAAVFGSQSTGKSK